MVYVDIDPGDIKQLREIVDVISRRHNSVYREFFAKINIKDPSKDSINFSDPEEVRRILILFAFSCNDVAFYLNQVIRLLLRRL